MLLNIFQKVKNEKDLNDLKRLITKEPLLYAEIEKIRKEMREGGKVQIADGATKGIVNKEKNGSTVFKGKVLVKKILDLEKKAHEKGKTKTPTNSEMLILFEKRLIEGLEPALVFSPSFGGGRGEVGIEGLNKESGETGIKDIRQLLKRLKVRSNSGVTVVSLLTKPYACPGRCIYCPTEVKMPKSYLSKEPAAARALANNFDPYKQMVSRLRALEMNGHPIDKLEIIVIGGTFDYYKKDYQEWFLKEIFRAANDYGKVDSDLTPALSKGEGENTNAFSSSLGGVGEVGTLSSLQKENETTTCRIIGLSVETRPDYITFDILNWYRYLGVTKIEIGVQHLDNHVLDFNGRQMTRERIAEATEVMRAAGFKFVYHMMPNLPESDEGMDVQMFKDLYNSKDFHPDMLKVYPNMILKTTLLYKMFTQKKDFVRSRTLKKKAKLEGRDFDENEIPEFKYEPYDDETLVRVLADCEREVKNYTRLIRMIRDIPATYILASSKKSNMREMVDAYQKERGFLQQDIRSREIRDSEVDFKDFSLRDTVYETTYGAEHFIEYINTNNADKIAGFVRLRLQDDYFDNELLKYENLSGLTDKCALVRELHVYGTLKKIGEEGDQSQHVGFGKRLMAEAERVARKAGYKKMAVIAGVGVRKYYEKIGYTLERSYMVKYL